MAFSMLTLGVLVILLSVAYDYWRVSRQSKNNQQQMQSREQEVETLLSSQRELSEEVTTLQNKLQQTFMDPVTQLLGWKLFEDRVRQAVKESERHRFTMALMVVDLDDFKTINDAMGYQAGDEVLKMTAQRLRDCLREVDNATRFTKDTFIVLLTQLSKPETAAIVAQRIMQSIAEPMLIEDQELYVTACVGIALFPLDGRDLPALLRNANHALHLAKIQGNQFVQFYEKQMQTASHRELLLANGLSREENFQQIQLYYQPVMDVKTRQVISLDICMRWVHPELGNVEMDEIIEHAEKHRKLNALILFMLRESCPQFIGFRNAGLNNTLLGVPLLVNQLEHPQFVYEMSQLMQDLGFQPAWLMLQIRDKFAKVSYDVIERSLHMLHYMQVKLAVDHFGADSLSLRYFKSIQMQFLKLAPAFAADLATDTQTRALVKAVHFFAQMMSIQLIICGVEDQEQLTSLEELGCLLQQGPALSPLLDESDVLSAIDKLAHA